MEVSAWTIRSEEGWWAVMVPDVPGVFTQARELDQVPAQVTDAVRTMLGDEGLEVTVKVVVDPGVAQSLN